MIIYVKWLFAVLLTIPMILLGWYLLRQFNLKTLDIKAERAEYIPRKGRKKVDGSEGAGKNTKQRKRK